MVLLASICGFLFPVDFILRFGLVPSTLAGKFGITLLTCAFFHSTVLHLIGNLLFLTVLFPSFEKRYGALMTMLLFVVGAIGAGLAHTIVFPESSLPATGASGPVTACLACLLMLSPKSSLFKFKSFRLSVSQVFYLAIAVQLIGIVFYLLHLSMLSLPGHLGGFVGGLLFFHYLRGKKSLQLVTSP